MDLKTSQITFYSITRVFWLRSLTNLYPFIPDNLLSDKVRDGELIGNKAAYVLEVAVGLVRLSSNIERAEKSAVGRPLIGRIDARPLAVTTIRRG